MLRCYVLHFATSNTKACAAILHRSIYGLIVVDSSVVDVVVDSVVDDVPADTSKSSVLKLH